MKSAESGGSSSEQETIEAYIARSTLETLGDDGWMQAVGAHHDFAMAALTLANKLYPHEPAKRRAFVAGAVAVLGIEDVLDDVAKLQRWFDAPTVDEVQMPGTEAPLPEA